jgi:hypothetical protein
MSPIPQTTQRLTATVIRALWKKSPQMFVESYRILHDRPVADALFEGERLLARYEIQDAHRLGPLRILRRPLDMSADDARRYFGGNVSPYITVYNPTGGWPPEPAPETEEERSRPGAISSWEHRRNAMQHNRTFRGAPKNIADDDVLWDVDNLVDWYGVRYLRLDSDGITECLDAVCLEYTRLHRFDRSWEILQALRLTPAELLAMEYQIAVVPQNNANLLQVLRRSRLSDDEYVAHYVGDAAT